MENKEKDLPKVKEKKLKVYTVLKQFTGSAVNYPSSKVSLDPKDDNTTYLLNNKFIK